MASDLERLNPAPFKTMPIRETQSFSFPRNPAEIEPVPRLQVVTALRGAALFSVIASVFVFGIYVADKKTFIGLVSGASCVAGALGLWALATIIDLLYHLATGRTYRGPQPPANLP